MASYYVHSRVCQEPEISSQSSPKVIYTLSTTTVTSSIHGESISTVRYQEAFSSSPPAMPARMSYTVGFCGAPVTVCTRRFAAFSRSRSAS